MIIVETKVDQTLCDVVVYAEFGKGKISVGAFRHENDGELFYCLSIREIGEAKEVGSSLDKNEVEFVNANEIILSFPTENQMIAVLAAFTNKSFEVVDNKWKAAQAKKDAK